MLGDRANDNPTTHLAQASVELLARTASGVPPEYFRCTGFRLIDERRRNAKGE